MGVAFLFSTVSVAAKLPNADKVLADAKAKAGAQKKNVLLVFETSWCPPCRQFDRFLADQRMRSIFDQYFVVATLAVGEEVAGDARKNNPGSAELLLKLGGVRSGSTGVPFIFVIDPQGKIIVTSVRIVPGQGIGDNIGYPTEPEETEWFMKMMKDGAPSLSEHDARAIEDWLRRNAES
jgi:thioredoxin-related protein